ncbi:hypothetical protein EDB85DRAFT_1158283 [Lactarius pseudohatsudake]|nr:hypothetical protein EDB85DRAFT_1158283 [Lactarius pseudohatsudake]
MGPGGLTSHLARSRWSSRPRQKSPLPGEDSGSLDSVSMRASARSVGCRAALVEMACAAAPGGPARLACVAAVTGDDSDGRAGTRGAGVTAQGARRKMLKTFEVICGKMGIDDPTAPPLRCRRRLVDLHQRHQAQVWEARLAAVACCPPRNG